MTATPAQIDVIPPVPLPKAARTAAVGAALCGIAVVFEVAARLDILPFDESGRPFALSTLRLLLVAFGALAASVALSWRPDVHWMWLAAAGTALLASFGIPEPKPGDWDSARMLARVMTGLAVAGAALTAAPATVRYLALSAFALYHFGGILAATTWPETNGTPPPWVTAQAAGRLYLPYYRFLYLSNAYHFYSPEPGPASHLFLLLKSELTSKTRPTEGPEAWKEVRNPETGAVEWRKDSYEWVNLPNRRQHYKDPLGITYYRRLSITEMVSKAMPSRYTPHSFEKSQAVRRRQAVALGLGQQIPLDPRSGQPADQYRIPSADVPRYLLPSYARHVADEFSYTGRGNSPDRRVVSVKIFRVEHAILPADEFVGRRMPYNRDRERMAPGNPYHPTTYRPFYMGEYDADGVLLNPTDPMLYWLCPVLPKAVSLADPLKRDYEDYMSKYAGFEFDWEGRVGQ